MPPDRTWPLPRLTKDTQRVLISASCCIIKGMRWALLVAVANSMGPACTDAQLLLASALQDLHAATAMATGVETAATGCTLRHPYMKGTFKSEVQTCTQPQQHPQMALL